MMAIWALWFRSADPKARNIVIATLAGAIGAVLVGKMLEHYLPIRVRPYQAGLDGAFFPFDMGLDGQTSFPSDHAILFFALATGMFFSNCTLGIGAFLFAGVIVCLPGIYLGLHYPTDILAGAGIGVICSVATQKSSPRTFPGTRISKFSHEHPSVFIPSSFFSLLKWPPFLTACGILPAW